MDDRTIQSLVETDNNKKKIEERYVLKSFLCCATGETCYRAMLLILTGRVSQNCDSTVINNMNNNSNNNDNNST